VLLAVGWQAVLMGLVIRLMAPQMPGPPQWGGPGHH
jgi:hypothetical protein